LPPALHLSPAAPAPAPGRRDDLLLKVTPPRIPRDLVARDALAADQPRLRDAPVWLVQAPPGFGKTSLLAQWRREHLAHGAVVAWLQAQAEDEPARLVQALALAVRQASGRPGFGHTLLEGGGAAAGLAGITSWLAEVAQSALDVVLFVDEADRLPDASRELLAYLLHNAPPNLRAVIGARSGVDLGLADLADYGRCTVVDAAALRFGVDEAIALARARLGPDVGVDAVARLHALTEGWPLGLQLGLAAAAAGRDLGQVTAALAAPGAAAHEQLVQLLLAQVDPADLAFLTRIAILDVLHPELCRAVAGDDAAADRLARLLRETPLLVATEQGDWLALHALARDALLARLQALPPDEQQRLHDRAADWLEARGWLEPAAHHALAAGRAERAYALAEQSLYGAVMGSGHLASVLTWLDRMPPAELDRRPRLMLAVAWALALGNRHEEAGRWLARIRRRRGADDALRCECALIEGGAAVYADDPDRFAELHDPWATDPPLRDPRLLRVHANRSALRSLLEGEPALARLRQQQAPPAEGALDYLGRWSDFIVGLSYVWEGQVLLAEQLLRPALAQAEGHLGRRNPFVCMDAALLAAAVWERDRPGEAQALLANRLDVLEREALPDVLLLAYRTLARAAAAQGADHRALDLLAAMDAVGQARRLPRLRIASLADQVRLHARRFRSETCRDLAAQIDRLLADPALPQGRLWRRSVMLLREVAQSHAAIAAQAWRAAVEALARADAIALQTRHGRLHIELLALRAYALDRCGEQAAPLLREAVDLAATHGLLRIFVDAHPALGEWVAASGGAGRPMPPGPGPLAAPIQPAAREPAAPRAAPSTALTPKEREVLELLARNLSNKEIGLALQVGEQTVKWHVKNLFAKLDAGSRKQVVSRARILGLLEVA
jgi:LuxR family maltose regulon positive regulatory protein